MIETVAVKFDEFTYHTVFTQHLGHGQYQVGSGNAFVKLAGQLEANHIGDQHGYRLPQHRGLGFDAADAPAQHPQAVDHGGVRVGAHQRVRIGDPLFILQFAPDRFAEVFEVYLMADPGSRRHDAEAAKGLLAPAQKLVALMVALHLQTDVLFKGVIVAEVVHGNRVVDHQIDRRERIDFCGIAAETFNRFAHGGQVNHGRHAGEVLHQHPCRAIGDLPVSVGRLEPPG